MKITKQTTTHYNLKEGDFEIQMTTADNDSLKIKNYKGGDFSFENQYREETLDKWEAVAKLIIRAIKVARKGLEIIS